MFYPFWMVSLGMALLCLVIWSFPAQWGAIVSAGPCGPLCGANLAVSLAVGLSFFGVHVRVLYVVVVDFLHKVVVSRKDVAVRSSRLLDA